jgi:hypothetical protein
MIPKAVYRCAGSFQVAKLPIEYAYIITTLRWRQ